VFLLNGVSEANTPYGPMVTIEDINGLHHAIGLYVIKNPEQMTGAEFRFLRKQLELTQAQLDDYLRVGDQTVANYEKGNTSLGPVDPLMRMLYLISVLPEQTRLEVLKDMTAKISNASAQNCRRFRDVRLPSVGKSTICKQHEGCRWMQGRWDSL
jgi:DNA-binding transcriptional regulator YiaG